MNNILIFILNAIFISTVSCLSLVQLFGMEDLILDLGRIDPYQASNGVIYNTYTIKPNVFNYLARFQTRTDFCDYKCPRFYDFPCFILFGCNIQLRNLFLLAIVPIFTLILVGLCCGRGIWTLGCWGKYLALFSGVIFIAWVIDRIMIGKQIQTRRKKQLQYLTNQYKVEDGAISQKRMTNQSDGSEQ